MRAHLIRQLSGVRIQTSFQKYIMGDIIKGVADKLGTFEKMFKTRINKKNSVGCPFRICFIIFVRNI